MSLLCPTIQVPCPQFVVFRRYGHTKLPMCTESWNMVYFKDSQLQLWWGCHYAWTDLYKPQSLLYPMVQVSQIYACAPNQEKWFISQAHGSKFDGDVTILLHTFINFNLGAWSTNVFSVTASRLEVKSNRNRQILYTCSRRGAWQSQWWLVERMWVWSRNVPSGTTQVLHGELLRWNSAL